MSKLTLLASKEIWDETNPLPCVRISFLSDFTDGNLLVDWEQWVDFCDEKYSEDWVQTLYGKVEYERTLKGVNKQVLLDFIEWL